MFAAQYRMHTARKGRTDWAAPHCENRPVWSAHAPALCAGFPSDASPRPALLKTGTQLKSPTHERNQRRLWHYAELCCASPIAGCPALCACSTLSLAG
eukprot:6211941-Pleurochrysis_carterae.AAC.3